ncbi:hypothetical protein LZ30DRAFT_825554 [Colletotrichum cereale]|nr:hypothetical protein LZ30DRAFT_825554 [Colletotrichum cereale]
MSEPLGSDQIEIQARAYGLNFKDVFVTLGQMAPGSAMTGKAAGVVTAVGENFQANSGVVAIPDSVSFIDAASIPIIHYTALFSMTHVARLEKNRSVLFHAASGGVGQAAMQITQMIGTKIFATIFSSHAPFFAKHVMEATQGVGVGVVLNSLPGQLLMESWDCVAQLATFLEIRKANIYAGSRLNTNNLEKQATFAALDTSQKYQLRPEYMA